MDRYPMTNEVLTSPEACTVDMLLARAAGVAEKVDAYKDRRIKGVELPFAWETLDGVGVSLILRADYDPSSVVDPLLTLVEGDKAAHDFTLNLLVEDCELDELPPEVLNKLYQNDSTVDVKNLRSIVYDHDITMDFCLGEFNWEESRTYYLAGEEPEERMVIKVILDARGEEYEQDVDDEGSMGGGKETLGDVDELEVAFSGIEKDIDEQRTRSRVRQAMRIIDAIDLRRPIDDLSFAGPQPS